MDIKERLDQQLNEIRGYCQNTPYKQYAFLVDVGLQDAAFKQSIVNMKEAANTDENTGKAALNAADSFAMCRDLASRYACRSALIKKGLDSKLYAAQTVLGKYTMIK